MIGLYSLLMSGEKISVVFANVIFLSNKLVGFFVFVKYVRIISVPNRDSFPHRKEYQGALSPLSFTQSYKSF